MPLQEFTVPRPGAAGEPSLGPCHTTLPDVLEHSAALQEFNRDELRRMAEREFRTYRLISGIDQRIPGGGGALFCVYVDAQLGRLPSNTGTISMMRIETAGFGGEAWNAFVMYRAAGVRLVSSEETREVYVWATPNP